MQAYHSPSPRHTVPLDAQDTPPAPPQHTDLHQQSRLSVALAVLCALVTLILGVLLIAAVHCNLGLYEKDDRAPLAPAPYNLLVLAVPAPLRLVAATLCVALLCAAAVAVMVARLAHAPPPQHDAGQLFAHVDAGTRRGPGTSWRRRWVGVLERDGGCVHVRPGH